MSIEHLLQVLWDARVSAYIDYWYSYGIRLNFFIYEYQKDNRLCVCVLSLYFTHVSIIQ